MILRSAATLLVPRDRADYFTVRANAAFAKLSLREHCMHLKAEELTILAHTLTQVQELVVQDKDNLSANALSWDYCLLEEQANIDDTSDISRC